jgi:hypothetical protein
LTDTTRPGGNPNTSDTGVFEFDYTLDGSGKVTQTDVTDPRGYVQRSTFNSGEYHLTLTEALGPALERSTTLVRASPRRGITRVSDRLDRVTRYAYES